MLYYIKGRELKVGVVMKSARNNMGLWDDFLSTMPSGWLELSREMELMKGAKRDKDFVNALHTIMIHLGTGASLKETAAYAKVAGICDISSVSLFNRLVKFGPYFQAMCQRMVLDNNISTISLPERLVLVDSTDVKEPGPTGSHYRFHYGFSLNDCSCVHMELTAVGGQGTGETFARYPVVSGDHFIADRGYSHLRGISHVVAAGGKVLVRLNHKTLPLFTAEGSRFQLRRELEKLATAGDFAEWRCKIHKYESNEWIAGRVCAIRRDEESTLRAIDLVKEEAKRKRKTISPETLQLCQYTILFTTFDEEKYPAEKILEIYRWRWQIELVFKRFKSLLSLGCLAKKTDGSAKAWLYGKLMLALLIEKVAFRQRSFSPWNALPSDPLELQRQLVAAF